MKFRALRGALPLLVIVAALMIAAVADAATVANKPLGSVQANGKVNVIVISGNTAYLGGAFTAMRPAGSTTGGTTRNHAAAVDLSTGALLPWNPNVNNAVNSLAVSGSTVYIGGVFSTVGSSSRKNIAAVNATTGAVITGFKTANVNHGVYAIAPSGSHLYIGGAFTTIGGAARAYAADVSPTSGALNAGFAPVLDNQVRAITLTSDGIVLGGNFTTLNGASSVSIGKVNSSGGSMTWNWHGPPGGGTHPFQVDAITQDSTGIYAAGTGNGGSFMKFNSQGDLQFIGGTNGNVTALGLDGGYLYVGGHFQGYCGLIIGSNSCTVAATRHKLMAVSTSDGSLQGWNPTANMTLGVFAMDAGGGHVAVGGDFTKIGGVSQQGFARFG